MTTDKKLDTVSLDVTIGSTSYLTLTPAHINKAVGGSDRICRVLIQGRNKHHAHANIELSLSYSQTKKEYYIYVAGSAVDSKNAHYVSLMEIPLSGLFDLYENHEKVNVRDLPATMDNRADEQLICFNERGIQDIRNMDIGVDLDEMWTKGAGPHIRNDETFTSANTMNTQHYDEDDDEEEDDSYDDENARDDTFNDDPF